MLPLGMPLPDMYPELESGSPDADADAEPEPDPDPDPDPDKSTSKGGTIGRTETHITEC